MQENIEYPEKPQLNQDVTAKRDQGESPLNSGNQDNSSSYLYDIEMRISNLVPQLEQNSERNQPELIEINALVKEKYNYIFRLAGSSENSDACTLARELLDVRSSLIASLANNYHVEETNYLYYGSKNLVNEYDNLISKLEQDLRVNRKKTEDEDKVQIIESIDHEVDCPESPGQVPKSQENIDDSYLEDPKSIYVIANRLLNEFITRFQFQIKTTAEFTKFLKYKNQDLPDLKNIYESLERTENELKSQFKPFESLDSLNSGPITDKYLFDFKTFVNRFINEQESDFLRCHDIHCKNVWMLQTIISDIQSLMIEDVAHFLHKEGKIKN